MSQQFGPPGGAWIEPSEPLAFRFNGRAVRGVRGDTLASALLANGVHLVARSWKYHRPRGVMAAGVEDPNALVQLEQGARSVPNVRATEIELNQGLTAARANCFPGPKRAGIAPPPLPRRVM